MKKLLIALIGVAALCGCGYKQDYCDLPDSQSIYRIRIKGITEEIHKTVIDGHEYLLRGTPHRGGICHSASCPCHTNSLNIINN